MASLLYAAKWLRSVICSEAKDRPALPDAMQLQPLGISPAGLQAVVGEVELQLAAVSSLLEVEVNHRGGNHFHPQHRG